MIRILERVFGCSHKRTTFPISRAGSSAAAADPANLAYVVCLECGTEFDYDWRAMKMGRTAIARPLTLPWNAPKEVGTLSARILTTHQDQHAVSN